MNLKHLLKNGGGLTFAGVYNPFVAKIAAKVGFDGVYLSGAGLSNSMGLPDIGILGLNDFTYFGKFISDATRLPLIGDADTGFNDVEETVRAYIDAGFSALHIEDQVFPKRCGHLDGKEVITLEEMQDKVGRAVLVRDSLNKNFVIIVRTDARGADNIDKDKQLAESIKRAKAYKKAGADVIFPESLKSMQEFEEFRANVDGALLANMTEFGKSPFISYSEFHRIGYQIVIFPVSVFRCLAARTEEALVTIKKDGDQRNLVDKMMSRGEINKILEYDPKCFPS